MLLRRSGMRGRKLKRKFENSGAQNCATSPRRINFEVFGPLSRNGFGF